MGTAVPLCFPSVAGPLLWYPQHPPSRLCENNIGINRYVSDFLFFFIFTDMIHHHNSVINSVLFIISYMGTLAPFLQPKVNVTEFVFVCFLTEPKDDFGYQFLLPWIGKTALPFSYNIFWFITELFVKLLYSLTHMLPVSVFR